MRRFDLRSLRFGDDSEAWRRLPVEVAPFLFGGLEYSVAGGSLDADLTVARVGDRLTLALAFDTRVLGPCQRCLEEAGVAIGGRGLEYVRHGDSEGDEDDEGYVASYEVDLLRWVRDLVAEALPPKLLCGDECRGLCPACGVNLNVQPDHRHEEA